MSVRASQCLPWILVVSLFSSVRAKADSAFGLTGTGARAFAEKFEILYYALEGNYPGGAGALPSSLDPAWDPQTAHKVVREVAKLNYRTDGLGESMEEFQAKFEAYALQVVTWHLSPTGSAPSFPWYHPDAAALATAESGGIVGAIDRTVQGGVGGTVWEIGNEPNLYPVIAPAEYAAIYNAYYKVIKGRNPGETVLMGSLFALEPAPALRGMMEAAVREKLAAAVDSTSGLFEGIHQTLIDSVVGRFFEYSTLDYLLAALDALDPGVVPDGISLHVYPLENRPHAQTLAGLGGSIQSFLNPVLDAMAARGLEVPLWITEFGNLQSGVDEAQLAQRTQAMVAAFQVVPEVKRWLYYKATGEDAGLVLATGDAPLTRLAANPGFNPPDGNFSCDSLNANGHAYYLAAVGSPCGTLTAIQGFSQTPMGTSLAARSKAVSTLPARDVIGRLVRNPAPGSAAPSPRSYRTPSLFGPVAGGD